MATVGQLVVELRASTASFASDLGKAKQLSFNTAKEMERSFNIMGAAAVSALGAAAVGFTAFIAKSIDAADKMGKLAQRTGVTVENFSALAYAAKQSDISTETLSGALVILAKNLDKANQQTLQGKEAQSALATLFRGNIPVFKDASEAFLTISKRLEEIPDKIQRVALAQQIFGRSGAALLPMISGLDKAIARAKELGLVISQETAAAADKFNDQIGDMKALIDGLGLSIAAELLPALESTGAVLVSNAGKLQTFAKLLAQTISIMIRGGIQTAESVAVWAGIMDKPIAKFKELTGETFGPPRSPEDTNRLNAQIKIQETVSGMLSALKVQIDLFGKSAGEAEKYRLAIAGASKAQQELGKNLAQTLFVMEKASGPMPQPNVRPFTPNDLAAPDIAGSIPGEIPNISDLPRLAVPGAELLSKELGLISDKFKEIRPLAIEINSQLQDLFTQAIFHANSFGDALKRVAEAIASMALRMLVIQPLLNSLGGLFGGVGGLSGIGRSAGSTAGFAFLGSAVPGLADGGTALAGMPHMVGERGPELFMPTVSGTVVPNEELNGRGGTTINQFHFHGVQDADSFKRSKGQIGAFLQRQLAIAHGRNG